MNYDPQQSHISRIHTMITIAPELRELPHYQLADLLELQGDLKDLTERNAAKLRRSIAKHGLFVPFFVWPAPDGNTYILDGHQRKRTLVKDGHGSLPVPCVLVHADTLQEAKEKLLVISSQYGRITQEGFDEFTFDLPDIGEMVNFDALAFEFGQDEDEQAEQGDAEPQIDRAAELQEKWQTERGQLWAIGEHRLLCGDSTVRADVERVMGGERAELLFTSPPYADMREYSGNDLSLETLVQIFPVWNSHTCYFAVNLGVKRKEHEVVPYWDKYTTAATDSGLKLLSWNVWDKGMAGSISNQSAMFSIIHEFVFVFGTKPKELNRIYPNDNDGNKKRRRYDPVDSRGKKQRLVRQADGTTKYSNRGELFEYKQMGTVHPITPEQARNHDHPAMFPVELPEEYIKSMTNEVEIVCDPFVGSGTTLVACQNLNRRGRAIEISPAYCAVILQRMADAFPGIEIHQLP